MADRERDQQRVKQAEGEGHEQGGLLEDALEQVSGGIIEGGCWQLPDEHGGGCFPQFPLIGD